MGKRIAMTLVIGLLAAGMEARKAGDEKEDAVAKDMKLF